MTVSELVQALANYAPGAMVMYEGDDYLYEVVSIHKPNEIVYLTGEHRDERDTNP